MNVLLVVADQHHAGWMGCAGHPQAITPNLDRLAREGVRFSRAYCQNPICTPSRVSILSGQYCHNHGIYGLSGPAPAGLNNLMRHFRQAGYRTAAFGKLHLPHAPRNWLADDLDCFGDTYETIDGEVGKSGFLAGLEAHGLREWEDSWHNRWNYGPGSISLDAQPSRLPYEHTQERWSAAQAVAFIDQDADRPFCIEVAFQKPHHPLLPNQRFWDLYPEDLELPPTWHLEPEHRPPHFQETWTRQRERAWDYGQSGEPPEAGPRRAWRGTLACVTQVDDVLGELLQALARRGLTDETIVVYTSDHGAYHTIHGLPEKAPGICSDAVCRVPMIWRVPGSTFPARVCDSLIESVDIVPTLAALCGLPPLDSADGLDATGLLSGSEKALHQVAVTENPWSKSITWGPWRFVHYQRGMFPEGDEGELYRIDQDPDETANLYRDPGCREVVAEGRRLLLEWLIESSRLVTSHPARKTGSEPNRSYPTCGDGRAPNCLQPRHRPDNGLNYL